MLRPLLFSFAALLGLVTAAACGSSDDASGGDGGGGAEGGGGASGYPWKLPAGIPRPMVPEDNPMTEEKVALGRHLFYDTRLSGNGTYSCASCHKQELAFTDGLAQSIGSTEEIHPRSSMSLANIAYMSALTWANPLITELEQQAKLPMFGEFPVELGLAGKEVEMLARLGEEPRYVELFASAFPEDEDPIVLVNVLRALASFQRSLVSFTSPYDKWAYGGNTSAVSDAAKRGRDLFQSEKFECFHCHGGFAFTDSVIREGTTIVEQSFHNTALYNLDGLGAYPAPNRGVYELTQNPQDMGRFRAPSLRNVAVTAPYMHDGSIATLDEVLDHYARGGRLIESGPHAGDGAKNPLKSEFLGGFTLSPDERADLKAFLESLTDESFLTDPRFANPWETP